MTTLRSRLREWWRVHYMERGFGFVRPGFLTRRYGDLVFRAKLVWDPLRVAYPSGFPATHNWFFVYRKIPYFSATLQEMEEVRDRLMAEGLVPRLYWPVPEPLHPVIHPLRRTSPLAPPKQE